MFGCALAATKAKLGFILTLDKNHRIFRLERLPGGACTHWKSAALSRRTPSTVGRSVQKNFRKADTESRCTTVPPQPPISRNDASLIPGTILRTSLPSATS